jgi:mRNA-degrading endonuclease RelE of RelBE toxin-antitoxin system
VPRARLTADAIEELDQLSDSVRGAVLNALVLLRAGPWERGKPLRGELRPLWSCRVGRYRILYTIEGPRESATVVVRGIRHRTEAYRRRRRGQ